jgi:hypothetical protein
VKEKERSDGQRVSMGGAQPTPLLLLLALVLTTLDPSPAAGVAAKTNRKRTLNPLAESPPLPRWQEAQHQLQLNPNHSCCRGLPVTVGS